MCRHQHAENAAHRGTEPIERLDIKPRDQRRQVCEIHPGVVVRWHSEIIAAAASWHIRADDAVMRGQRFGDRVKITAVAREAMNAEQHRRSFRSPPFAIDETMEAMRAKTFDAAFNHDPNISQKRSSLATPLTFGIGLAAKPPKRCGRGGGSILVYFTY